MRMLRYSVFLCALLILLAERASATWSVIVIDAKTREIGIAGASCTYSVYGIGSIAPGKGALVVQAMSNNKARRKGLQMIMADATPEQILEALKDPQFDPEAQQYGMVCLYAMDQPKTYTGSKTNLDRGALTTTGISIQGNTLNNKEMLGKIMKAALKAQEKGLPIQEVLMLALEAGAEYGGDNRCGTRKAMSAFLTVAKPNDDPVNPYLNLIYNQSDDTTNAISALREKYNFWKNNR